MGKATTFAQLRALAEESRSYTAEVASAAADAIEAIDEEIGNEVAAAEESSAASEAHATGSYFRLGGNLYKATQAIAAGEVIEAGVNARRTSVAEELEAFSGLTSGITYSAATETLNIPTSIGSYADETIIFTV